MKNTNTNKLFLGLFLASSVYGSSYEYPQLYKDTKVMAMGELLLLLVVKHHHYFTTLQDYQIFQKVMVGKLIF
jgi:hypothetical protein